MEKTQVVCESVFKSRDDDVIRVEFTKLWIALVNYMESCKTIP